MFKVRGRVWSVLCCTFSALSSRESKAQGPSANRSPKIHRLKEKSDDESFQGQASTEPLTRKQEAPVKVQEAWAVSRHQGQK